ncbi:MAG: hypothetical protein KUL86_07015 [Castellaniella sp.]|nr:hypothetical protein [Castellaniella sp.]
MAKTDSTDLRVSLIFNEIAELAADADSLASTSDTTDDLHATYALACRLQSAIQRIGWLADEGTRAVGSDMIVRGAAENWMLPTNYPTQGEATE